MPELSLKGLEGAFRREGHAGVGETKAHEAQRGYRAAKLGWRYWPNVKGKKLQLQEAWWEGNVGFGA